jgi:hypothetical protein
VGFFIARMARSARNVVGRSWHYDFQLMRCAMPHGIGERPEWGQPVEEADKSPENAGISASHH